MRQKQQSFGSFSQKQGRSPNYGGNNYHPNNQNRNQNSRPNNFLFDRNTSNRDSNFQNSGWRIRDGEGRIVCFRCGKPGHYQLSCRTPERFFNPPQRNNPGVNVTVRPTFPVLPPRNTPAIAYSTQDVRTCLPLNEEIFTLLIKAKILHLQQIVYNKMSEKVRIM